MKDLPGAIDLDAGTALQHEVPKIEPRTSMEQHAAIIEQADWLAKWNGDLITYSNAGTLQGLRGDRMITLNLSHGA
jgi:hypothetical protein